MSRYSEWLRVHEALDIATDQAGELQPGGTLAKGLRWYMAPPDPGEGIDGVSLTLEGKADAPDIRTLFFYLKIDELRVLFAGLVDQGVIPEPEEETGS